MNEWFPDQLATAQKANLEALYGVANVAFEAFQKLTQLQVQAAKSTLADTQTLLSAADPQAWLTQQASGNVALAERTQAYCQGLVEIAADAHRGFATIAGAQYEAHNRRMQALFADVSKQAPAGSEAAVVALKKLLDSSSALHDSVNKSVRQVATLAEGSMAAILAHTPKTTGATTG
jgi:phasin family protein